MLLCTVELEPGTTRVHRETQSLKVYVPNCEPAGPDSFLLSDRKGLTLGKRNDPGGLDESKKQAKACVESGDKQQALIKRVPWNGGLRGRQMVCTVSEESTCPVFAEILARKDTQVTEPQVLSQRT